MAIETFIIGALAFLIAIFFSEIISDFLLIEYTSKGKSKRFKFRFNFGALNPFINHDKVIWTYIIQAIAVGIFSIIINNMFIVLITATYFYWLPIFTLTVMCLYILAIKKQKIKMDKHKWVTFSVLLLTTIVLFFLVYWIPRIWVSIQNSF